MDESTFTSQTVYQSLIRLHERLAAVLAANKENLEEQLFLVKNRADYKNVDVDGLSTRIIACNTDIQRCARLVSALSERGQRLADNKENFAEAFEHVKIAHEELDSLLQRWPKDLHIADDVFGGR